MAKKRKISVLGANIRHFRRERKMSQTKLADKAGLQGKVAVCKLEVGMYAGVADPEKLVRIAKALHISVERLVTPREEPPALNPQMEALLS
jgi:transcriptional regulator with XRE-family HTH domain